MQRIQTDWVILDLALLHHIQFLANMYSSEHSEFILSPLIDLLRNGVSACRGIYDGIESFPLCEYVTQSLFLKLTGAQEQKIKCICWDLATVDYEYRYEFLKSKKYGEWTAATDSFIDVYGFQTNEHGLEERRIIGEYF